MKILCLCDHGNNRSIHLAHHLKYWGHDVLAAGVDRNLPETLRMLYAWADKIIITDRPQLKKILSVYDSTERSCEDRVILFDVGPDIYKRPFNPELLVLVKKFLKENKAWVGPQKNGR